MRLAVLLCAGLSALGSSATLADDFSFTGNFISDGDVQKFRFTLDQARDVTLVTRAYGGGTNAH